MNRTARQLARGLIPIVVLLVAVGALTALGTPNGHSYGFNMTWHVAFADAIGGGAFYPRQLPGLWFGLGGLDFFFYGPFPFWVSAGPATWLCPGCTPQTVFGLTGGLLWAASGLTFWPLARRFMPAGAASLAALVYMLMPYHIGIDWVLRQAVGEFAAYIFVPLCALGVIRAMAGERVGLSLPIGFAGLLLCHLPTALLAGHVFGIIFLVWAATQPRKAGPACLRIVGAALPGLALAGLYWLPAIVLLGDVSPAALESPELRPDASFLIGLDMLPDSKMKVAILFSLLASVAVAGLASRHQRRTGGPPEKATVPGGLVLWSLLPALLVLALNTSLTAPLWEHWVIGRVQFPYRLTVFADLAAAVAAGVLVAGLSDQDGRAGLRRVAGLGVLALAMIAVLPLLPDRIIKGIDLNGTPVWMIGAPEYIPPDLFAPLALELEQDGEPIWRIATLIEERVPEIEADPAILPLVQPRTRHWHVDIPIDAGADGGPILLALPYWQHMVPASDTVTISADPATGLTALRLVDTDGAQQVTITLPWHWSEWAGAGLSLAGAGGVIWIGLAGLCRPGRPGRRSPQLTRQT